MTPLDSLEASVVTPAELAALQAYLDCGSVKEAAHALGVKETTVKTLLVRLRAKTNARTTAESVWILRDVLARNQSRTAA